MRPPVFRWLWRVPGVMCSNKGLALYMPKVKLSWQKICSLNSVFFPRITLPSPFPSESASASQTECYCRYYHPNFTAGGAKDGVVILCQRFAMSSCCDSQSFGPQPQPLSLHPPSVLVTRSGFLILGGAARYFTQQFLGVSGVCLVFGLGFFSKSLNLARIWGRFRGVPGVTLLQEQLVCPKPGICWNDCGGASAGAPCTEASLRLHSIRFL